jgi:alpha-ketoglutarate-dependent taurine dioxygenase
MASVVQNIRVESIKPKIGAVVHADKRALLDPAFAPQVIELLNEHVALVFPKIGLTDEEQLAFTDSLGDRVNFTNKVPGGDLSSRDVYTITLDKEINSEPEYVVGSMFWHGDGITMDIPPPKYTILSCKHPPAKGGQTEFCNTFAAWEALPADEQAELYGLRVVHSVWAAVRGFMDYDELNPIRREFKHEHPLVWTHTDGRKSLLVGSHADFVVGMDKGQGRALLARLLEWAAQPEFCCRHTWSEGDLAIWDNCGSLHRALPYAADSGRRMHRTTVAGYEEIR